MKNTSPGSNRIVVLLTALLVAVGLTAMTTTAIADGGQGGSGNGQHKHHHHHHKCPKGTHKKVFFKHGKRHKKCVPDEDQTGTPTSPGTSAGLVINPASFTFPDTEHAVGSSFHDFVVTNKGGSRSGTLNATVTDVADPNPGDGPAFTFTQNGCTAALAPGATCTVTVKFAPPSNAGDEHYASVLHVAGSPGGNAQSQIDGIGD
jgi:hypothetical protein